MRPTIIAIDGPAGSGKSTTAQLIARTLGLGYVDTGATYRLVAHRALQRGVPLDDAEALAAVAKETLEQVRLVDASSLHVDGSPVGAEIRTPEVSEATSITSAHPAVRSVVVPFQRALVPPQGAVVEGRDIGTVVWPDADLKVYLDASPDVRMQRRGDATGRPESTSVEVVERDERDASRAVAPMRPAADAVLVDTSNDSPETVAAKVIDLLRPRKRSPLYVVMRAILALLLRTAFRLEVVGIENIPKHGGVIVAPNHRSLIDHPVVGVITDRQVWFMGKSELFKNDLAAKFLRALGAFPVNRGKPDRASLQRCLELLEGGEVVGIYPEGTRRPDSRFDDVEDGFAYIALKSGAPIVPIAVSGTESVLPHGKRFPRFVKIRVVVGEPFRLGGKHAGVLPRSRIREAVAEAQPKLEANMSRLEPRGAGGGVGGVPPPPPPTDRMRVLPVVAVVGRPNVGKSSLVNRILGRRASIVEERPGVTRDRVLYTAEWRGRPFHLIDTGGLESSPTGELGGKVAATARAAAGEADVVIFVLDVTEGVTPEDVAVADVIRRLDTKVVVVANKADSDRRDK
ncbi:MAG: (d)CMP kinase, partial [Actinomycetota bacterium]